MQRVRANVSLRAIYHNAEAFRKLTGTRLCAVVKANAYGHGAPQVAYALHTVASCFAVSLLSEAKAICTAACGRDILVLTPPLCDEEIFDGLVNGFLLTVPDRETAERIAEAARRYRLTARVHIKLNTGMNRYGMEYSELSSACEYLRARPFVRVEGFYSHLYQTRKACADEQLALFLRGVAIGKGYYPNATAHIGATYGALLSEAFALDMVRVGIGLYGYLPDGAEDLNEERLRAISLQRAMRVTATVAARREYRYGGAGYGTPVWEAEDRTPPSHLSVCRFGYADGVLRKRDNGTETAEGHANNACMDATLLTGDFAKGTEICVMQDAAETAKRTGTISYEVLCAATRRAEFIYDE